MNRELDDAIEILDVFREKGSCPFKDSNICQAVFLTARQASSRLNVGLQMTHSERSKLEVNTADLQKNIGMYIANYFV